LSLGPISVLVLGSAVVLFVLLRVLLGGDEPLGLARLGLALSGAAGVALLELPVAISLVPSFFFAISLAYVDLVVVVPLAAWAVILRSRKRSTSRAVRTLAWTAAVALPAVGVYATFVEPFRLVEERVAVELDARHAPSEPLRVAVLADLQSREVDDHLRDAVRRAMDFEPHLILLPGDLIQEAPDEYDRVAPDFRALLADLDAPLGVYFVLGNTDDPTRIRGVFEGTKVRLLENEAVELEFGGKRVFVGGAGFRTFAPDTRSFCTSFDRRSNDELRILASHYPDAALELGGARGIDLIVAGHTHGGQIQIPGFGAPLTLSRVPRRVGSGGLHTLEGRQIYISRGVGCERGEAPRVRFLCPPEVSLLTLAAAPEREAAR